jgi:hypothetical protein
MRCGRPGRLAVRAEWLIATPIDVWLLAAGLDGSLYVHASAPSNLSTLSGYGGGYGPPHGHAGYGGYAPSEVRRNARAAPRRAPCAAASLLGTRTRRSARHTWQRGLAFHRHPLCCRTPPGSLTAGHAYVPL